MSERSKEWVLERVRKLLNLGQNSGATEGERDNAMRMAHSLLAKYNLDMAELKLDTGEEAEDRKIIRSPFYGRPWARQVARNVARLFFCGYIYMPATKATDTVHFFVGKESNAITACEMSAYLVTSIRREGRAKNPTGENVWLRSFCVGAAVRIEERVGEIIEAAAKQNQRSSSGTSLVLASIYQTEQAANIVLLDSTFKKKQKGRSGKSDGLTDAYNDGREYGNRVGLNRQVEGDKAREQLENKS